MGLVKEKKYLLGLIVISLFLCVLYFYDAHKNNRIVGSINCESFDIDVRLVTRPNWLEGDGIHFSIELNGLNDARNFVIGGGGFEADRDSHHILPVNTKIPVSIYSSSSPLGVALFLPNENLENGTDPVNKVFALSEYESLDACISKNIRDFNDILASMKSYIPKLVFYRSRNYISDENHTLTALVYASGDQESHLLDKAGVSYNYEVFSEEGGGRVVRISTSGALRFDYSRDVGLDIFTTDFSKPLPEEYQWLGKLKNEGGISLIDRLVRIQNKIPVEFNN